MSDERVPPGQTETKKWPVLHTGPVPRFEPATWDLRIFGEVERPLRLTWPEWLALPRVRCTADFHCVTTWSRLDNEWEGVAFAEIERRAGTRASARHVVFHGEHGYTANVRIEDARAPDVLLAIAHDGAPLAPEHGYPLRLVVPHLYAWKSVKWVRGLEFLAQEAAGFWERNGYHIYGDPWKEQRYDE